MTELTTKELDLLRKIPENEFFTGNANSAESLEDLAIWTDCFLDTCGMSVESAKGVLGSLTKKLFVEVSGGRDSVIILTDKAINLLLKGGK